MPAKAFPMYKERSKDALGGADSDMRRMREDKRPKHSKSLYAPGEDDLTTGVSGNLEGTQVHPNNTKNEAIVIIDMWTLKPPTITGISGSG
jgi:hypothetical protein